MERDMTMSKVEKRAASTLAFMFGLRMLGLFLILPVFSVYAHGLEGALEHPALVGVALGAYGLTQALLQIPFGMLSDRIGRKPVIAAGMALFALGSAIAALSSTIEGVLVGRVIQGSGAVAAAIIALTADLTREEHRTKAMAMIGMTIGVSFAVSLVLGPILDHLIGVPGIFWLTAFLALASILVLYSLVPDPKKVRHHRDSEPAPEMFGTVLRNLDLLRLDFGVFVLHMGLTAIFVVMPIMLVDPQHPLLSQEKHWMLYLPVMLLSFAFMIPMIVVGEKRRKLKEVFIAAIAMVFLAVLGMGFSGASLVWIGVCLLVFFIGFNVLEASMPSMVSKFSPPAAKGTAVGVFNSSEFLGAFFGGVLGGLIYDPKAGNYAHVFWVVAAMFAVWLIVAAKMNTPPYLSTRMFRVTGIDEKKAASMREALLRVPGVFEAEVFVDEEAVYCKVDVQTLDEARLQRALHRATS